MDSKKAKTLLHKLDEFNRKYKTLFDSNRFIANSELDCGEEKLTEFLKDVEELKKKLETRDLHNPLIFIDRDKYVKMTDIVLNAREYCTEHNRQYIKKAMTERKEYLDNLLTDYDPNVLLDENQREIVLCDEDNILVSAGAGTGKTTTIAAKIKHLVNCGVPPRQILAISFTTKAVGELAERICGALGIPCEIRTFHALALKLIADRLNQPIIAKNELIDERADIFIREELKKQFRYEELEQFVMYLLMCSKIEDHTRDDRPYNELPIPSIRAELISQQVTVPSYNSSSDSLLNKGGNERMPEKEKFDCPVTLAIANWFVLHGFDYVYRPDYNAGGMNHPVMQDAARWYIPTFAWEKDGCFGYIDLLTQENENTDDAVRNLNALHRKFDERGFQSSVIVALPNDCESAINQLQENLQNMERALDISIIKQVLETPTKYKFQLQKVLTGVVGGLKTQNLDPKIFNVWIKESEDKGSVRKTMLLKMCKLFYWRYTMFLVSNDLIDTEDMINRAIGRIKTGKVNLKEYRYIFIDEYQDSSGQKTEFIKLLRTATNAKVIAVGDDRQSLYEFAGAVLDEFYNFEKRMGFTYYGKINKTYRNSMQNCRIAGEFISANARQTQGVIVSEKQQENPLRIVVYGKKQFADANTPTSLDDAIDKCLADIINDAKTKNNSEPSILFLARINRTLKNLSANKRYTYNKDTGKVVSMLFPSLKIEGMTIHKAKGLGRDYIVLLSGEGGYWGFPFCKENDELLDYVIQRDESIAYAEERRLMYVALTRTKNINYVVAPADSPSPFLLEILKKTPEDVEVIGDFNISDQGCIVCGAPVRYGYVPAYKRSMFACTAPLDRCGAVYKKKDAMLPTYKCPACSTGFLTGIKSKKTGDIFYGCTNYDGLTNTGCNCTLSENKRPVYSSTYRTSDSEFFEFAPIVKNEES